ncbi:arylsulfatase [Labilibacter marinus]|uniref:arylsulfatase n=1 Tax=Labilibacter marinus TaxID=1477105 RepID=UPI00083399ED|nr:arylsulfatase [Labilibacter marinus]
MKIKILLLLAIVSINAYSNRPSKNEKAPNVILILTDDQGIGELACHGNPWIKTPNIDKFYKDAVRMTDFHVSPVCTPTRGAIMTGRYPINNGAWATYKGRDALSEDAPTMANVFKQNGYKTAIFGKWHLGDNYPVRPDDCGFEHVVRHLAGGVGELSDYWGNNYFDDVYLVNNKPTQFKGYCTDIWFQEAMNYISDAKDEAKPFFIYLPTNAPHGPLYVDEKYAKPYKHLVGDKIVSAEFYGMITNIDENFGKLEAFLKKNKIADNTILIYMTDNGSSYGVSKDGKVGYNMGLRGSKGYRTEGGHRVPFFIRWKDGKVKGGRDIAEATAHVDLIPTLASLCQLNIPESMKLDGLDFSPLLLKKTEKLPKRNIYVHSRQDWRPPMDVNQTCIVNNKWRLVNGNEYYNIETDRMQLNNLASQHPTQVQELLQDNDDFLKVSKANPEYNELPLNIIGNPKQNPINLTIQHAIGEGRGIWKSEQVAAGMKNVNNTHALKVDRAGQYTISCRRWPIECPGKIWGVPAQNPKDWFTYKTIQPQKVRIKIANQILEKDIKEEDVEVTFNVFLEKGKTLLVNDFIEGKKQYGVYYTYITYNGE